MSAVKRALEAVRSREVLCDSCGFASPDVELIACPRCAALLIEREYDPQALTAAEMLALQDILSRAYLRRMDAANGYLCWPPDGLASELDELASDVAFERTGYLS
jgi:hypothetical protein